MIFFATEGTEDAEKLATKKQKIEPQRTQKTERRFNYTDLTDKNHNNSVFLSKNAKKAFFRAI